MVRDNRDSETQKELAGALARLVLPPSVKPQHLYEHGRVGRYTQRQVLRYIADQLDGPLAEAWERSVRAARVLGYDWPEARDEALRALKEPGDG